MALIELEQSSRIPLNVWFGMKVFVPVAELRRRGKIKKSLGRLSDRELRDIGLIMNDVEHFCSKPLSQDAAIQIDRAAKLRSGNW